MHRVTARALSVWSVGRRFSVAVLLAIGHLSCCSDQEAFPVMADLRDLTANDLREKLGEPRDDRVTTVGELLRTTDLRDVEITARAKRLDPTMTVRYFSWEPHCWGRRDDYLVAMFSPTTDRLVTVDGLPLIASRTAGN